MLKSSIPLVPHIPLLADSFYASVGFQSAIFLNHCSFKVPDCLAPSCQSFLGYLSLCVREKVRVPSYFLLTQFKVKFCFHKEALSYLSILYCTQPFSHPKASHSYLTFLCFTYTYFLNIFPTFISLKSSFLKSSPFTFFWHFFPVSRFLSFVNQFFSLLTLNLSGNGFLTLLQKPPL